jgi:DNA-binding response OmpR family regulator
MRLLIVEDSDILRNNLARGLGRAGHVVDTSADGLDGKWRAETGHYDVIILDLNLPGLDGMDLLTEMRETGGKVPVLILTARDALDQRVTGLRGGADDYLVKPFDFEELLARVEVLARRTGGAAENVLTFGALKIDLAARTAAIGEKPVPLARREFALLEVLALNPDRIVSRSEIEARIYDDYVEPLSNVLDSAVSILRRAIDTPGEPSRIQTRRGQGYRLVVR